MKSVLILRKNFLFFICDQPEVSKTKQKFTKQDHQETDNFMDMLGPDFLVNF